MRLLRAELTKLRRPLTLWIAIAGMLATFAFAWQGAKNASAAAHPKHAVAARPPACKDFALPVGALCNQAISVQEQISAYRQHLAATQPSTRHNARPSDAGAVEHPLAAGKVSLGFMASLGGALLIFLLAAGHVGGEWDQRTIRTIVSQEGRRWRVLGSKLASVWAAALTFVLVDWAVLACASPVLKALYPLTGRTMSVGAAWAAVAADAGRAPLVIGVFSVIGVSAAVILRNALGAFALAGGFLLASITAAGNVASVAPWTLTYWVSGWMQFRSHGFVLYHFWVDGYPEGVHRPGVLVGFAGIVAVIGAAGTVASAVFRVADIAT